MLYINLLDITIIICSKVKYSSNLERQIMRNKSEKFVELANKRVNRAIDDIRLIGNLSNRSNYEYSPEQVAKIFQELQSELAKSRARFTEINKSGRQAFKLEGPSRSKK